MKNRMWDAKRALRDTMPSVPVGSGGEKIIIHDHINVDCMAGDVLVDPKIRPSGYTHPNFSKLKSIADGALSRLIEHLTESENKRRRQLIESTDKQQSEESYNLMAE